MSQGYVHTKASLILAGGFLLGTIASQDISNLEYVVGALAGVFVTPDCDVDAGMITDRYIRNKIGWVAEKAWDGTWYMYRRSLKHGGELSHFPIIGTLGRLAYLFFFLVVVPYIFIIMVYPYDFWGELAWWIERILERYRMILALMGADFIHWGLDILTTEHKKTSIRPYTSRV